MTLSPWAFAWITRLHHHYNLALATFAVLSILNFLGLFFLEDFPNEFGLVWLSIGIMSVVSIKLMDSYKSALIIFLFSTYVVWMLIAALNWIGIRSDENAVLGWVVVMTMVVSHLVHFMSALLREMARGTYQQEALSEALSLVHQPVLLSSLTTVFGFVVAAYFNEELINMAWVVVLGTFISYLMVVFGLPLVLMKFFLEFRVGHYEDRHGLEWVQKRLQQQPKFVFVLGGLASFLTAISIWGLLKIAIPWEALGIMLTACLILLMFFWGKLFLPLFALSFAVVSLCWVLGVFSFVTINKLTVMVMVVPLGIILDDVVHFFTRYKRAENFFLVSAKDKVKFALTSVGRPLWLTTQLLVISLLVLMFSENIQIVLAAGVTLMAVTVSSFLLLIIFPALVTFLGHKENF